MPLRLLKSGQPIETAGDWRRNDRKPGAASRRLRGHDELADAFFGNGYPEVPNEILAAGTSHPDLADLHIEWGIPSHRVAIGPFRDARDETDVVLIGSAHGRRVAVSVDAVGDESFGEGLADFVRRCGDSAQKRLEELAGLLRALVPDAPPTDKAVLKLRLLLSMASALVFAQRQHAEAALLVFLEFDRDGWPGRGTRAHRFELNDLARVVFGPGAALTPGCCLGPAHVPGGHHIPGDIPLYLAMGHRNADARFH